MTEPLMFIRFLDGTIVILLGIALAVASLIT